MDTKNVIAAISLSAAVIILYSLFFAPSPKELKDLNQEKTTLNSEAPKLDVSEKIIEISREDAIKDSDRIKFENENIKGSISLKGGIIDDLIFKNYTETLEGQNNISGIEVTSPIIGTAYHAPEPGAKKFVEVGKKIKKGETVMIVEAMKTMNHVPSSSDGIVKKILVSDGQPVEFGQTLIILE